MALSFAADLRLARGETQLSQELAEQASKLATEQGIPNYMVLGECIRGSALIAQGRVQEGISSLCRGLAEAKTLGARIDFLDFLPRLGQAYASLGQSEAAEAALNEALAERASLGEHYRHDAELYRVKGELTLQHASQEQGARSKEQEAEECFIKAIEIAQRQQAKSLELRAVMSLARLWHQQGETTAAHQMLSEIYTWFTEGFDTKDLQEAKVLLKELRD